MSEPVVFEKQDADRIVADVRWGEMQRATPQPAYRALPQPTMGAFSGTMYAIARQRDAEAMGETITVVPLMPDPNGVYGMKMPLKPNPLDPQGEPVPVTDTYRCYPGTRVRDFAQFAQPTGNVLKASTPILPVFWSLGVPYLVQLPKYRFPWPNEKFSMRGCKPVLA